jgi:hypothetical protein
MQPALAPMHNQHQQQHLGSLAALQLTCPVCSSILRQAACLASAPGWCVGAPGAPPQAPWAAQIAAAVQAAGISSISSSGISSSRLALLAARLPLG